MKQKPWNDSQGFEHFRNKFTRPSSSYRQKFNGHSFQLESNGPQSAFQLGVQSGLPPRRSNYQSGINTEVHPAFSVFSSGQPQHELSSQIHPQLYQSAFQVSQPSASSFPAGQGSYNNSHSQVIPAPSSWKQSADTAKTSSAVSAFSTPSAFSIQPQAPPTNPFQSGESNHGHFSAFSAVPSGNAQQPRKEKKRNGPNFDKREKRREKAKNNEAIDLNKDDMEDVSTAKPITDFPCFPPGSFTGREVPNQETSVILKPTSKPLISIKPNRDSWDVQNQATLSQIEQEYLNGGKSLQSAYELMAQMRTIERLEMEKRGLVDSTEVRKKLTDAIQFVGSCLEMCPVFERVRRAHENNTLSFEKNKDGQVVKNYAVKAFSRPAAGQPPPLPSDVRPPNVLVSTLRYLVSDILPKLPSAHPFIWDRTRSIRQDFTYQNYQGDEALWCLEVIARIHCVSFHRMAKTVASEGEWSQQQEIEQFNKCLQSLSEFYQSRPLVSSNEGEIRAYQLLSHFFDNELVSAIDRLPECTSKHPLVNLALELRSIAEYSVTKFFHRIREPDVPPTFRAVAEIHFNKLRMWAVRKLVESMHKRVSMYSMARFVNLLGFESTTEAKRFCSHFDLNVSVSPEAGEEIDIRSWDECNVRDKQALAQSFDESLDSLINSLDVLQPLALNSAQGGWQASSGRLIEAKQIVSYSGQVQPSVTTKSPAHQLKETENALQRPSRDDGEKQRVFGEQLQEQQKQRKELEITRQKKQIQVKAEEEAMAKALEQQKAQLKQRESIELKRKLQEQLQERVRQRDQFVDRARNHLFSQLFNEVCQSDCDAIIRSINMNNKRILSRTVKTAKKKAQASLEKRKIKHIRAQELSSFREAKTRQRVVSNRANTKALFSEPEVSHPPSDLPVIRQREDNCRSESFSSVQSQLPSGRFDWQILIPLLSSANSFGLDRMYFAAEWSSPYGKWLEGALQLDCFIRLEQNVEFKLLKYQTEESVDACLVETGYNCEAHFSVWTWTASARHMSLQELGDDLESVLLKYMDKMHDNLQRHKSLAIKRRRISIFDRGSLNRYGLNKRLENPVTTLMSKPNVALRIKHLRSLVAETKLLARDF